MSKEKVQLFNSRLTNLPAELREKIYIELSVFDRITLSQVSHTLRKQILGSTAYMKNNKQVLFGEIKKQLFKPERNWLAHFHPKRFEIKNKYRFFARDSLFAGVVYFSATFLLLFFLAEITGIKSPGYYKFILLMAFLMAVKGSIENYFSSKKEYICSLTIANERYSYLLEKEFNKIKSSDEEASEAPLKK